MIVAVLNFYALGKQVPENAVYIGRGNQKLGLHHSMFANPFPINAEQDRDAVVEKYKNWIWKEIKEGSFLLEDILKLQGKDLVCYCAPKKCHGDILEKVIVWAAEKQSLLDSKNLTSEQIESCLTDKVKEVRLNIANRHDFTATQEQIERGLQDEAAVVRRAFMKRPEFKPTPEYFDLLSGLEKSDIEQEILAKHKDFVPTLAQMERVLESESNSRTKDVFLKRKEEFLSKNERSILNTAFRAEREVKRKVL
jgi:hypothetical protein